MSDACAFFGWRASKANPHVFFEATQAVPDEPRGEQGHVVIGAFVRLLSRSILFRLLDHGPDDTRVRFGPVRP